MSNRIKQGYWLVAAGLVASVTLAPRAAAQESSADTYGGPGATAFEVTQNVGGAGSAADPAAGSLPFTGFDTLLALGGGVLLLVAGLALARTLRPGDAEA